MSDFMDFKKLIVSLILLVVSCLYASAQFIDGAGYEDLYDSETVSAMKSHVRFLSASALEGRRAGSEGEKQAAAYVADAFKEYGVDILTPSTG